MTRFQVHIDGQPQPTLHINWGEAYAEAFQVTGVPFRTRTGPEVAVERVQVSREER